MFVKKRVVCPLAGEKWCVKLWEGFLWQVLFPETFDKGEKSPVRRGSQNPASRCLWLLLVLPLFRHYEETGSASGAAKGPVSNAERDGCRLLSLSGLWMEGEVQR